MEKYQFDPIVKAGMEASPIPFAVYQVIGQRVYTLILSEGFCQLCNNQAPFLDSNGRPYLEAHHIVPLADNGPDELTNMVALCPNCHRKMHVINQKEDVAVLQEKAST